jgi:hypothetical protein
MREEASFLFWIQQLVISQYFIKYQLFFDVVTWCVASISSAVSGTAEVENKLLA